MISLSNQGILFGLDDHLKEQLVVSLSLLECIFKGLYNIVELLDLGFQELAFVA